MYGQDPDMNQLIIRRETARSESWSTPLNINMLEKQADLIDRLEVAGYKIRFECAYGNERNRTVFISDSRGKEFEMPRTTQVFHFLLQPAADADEARKLTQQGKAISASSDDIIAAHYIRTGRIDAAYMKVYGLSEREVRFIVNHATRHGLIGHLLLMDDENCPAFSLNDTNSETLSPTLRLAQIANTWVLEEWIEGGDVAFCSRYLFDHEPNGEDIYEMQFLHREYDRRLDRVLEVYVAQSSGNLS